MNKYTKYLAITKLQYINIQQLIQDVGLDIYILF